MPVHDLSMMSRWLCHENYRYHPQRTTRLTLKVQIETIKTQSPISGFPFFNLSAGAVPFPSSCIHSYLRSFSQFQFDQGSSNCPDKLGYLSILQLAAYKCLSSINSIYFIDVCNIKDNAVNFLSKSLIYICIGEYEIRADLVRK